MRKGVPEAFRYDGANQALPEPIDELLSSGRFRSGAIKAAQELSSQREYSSPGKILPLFYIRLACLQLSNLQVEAVEEAKALQDLNSPFYRDSSSNKHYAPWELRVLATRLHAIGSGDWRRCIIAWYELAREARLQARKGPSEEREIWHLRVQELGLLVAYSLVEMGDLETAVEHLKSLTTTTGNGDSLLRSRLALLLIRVGDFNTARDYVSRTTGDGDDSDSSSSMSHSVFKALLWMADEEYEDAIGEWNDIATKESYDSVTRAMASQNLAVCHVYCGRIAEVCFPSKGLQEWYADVHVQPGSERSARADQARKFLPRGLLQFVNDFRAHVGKISLSKK